MSITPISRQKLYELLCNSRGGQWVTFTAVTRPRMNLPWRNLFWKVAVVRVKLKCNYTRCVNQQRAKEGKDPNFVSGPLPWGKGDIDFPNSPFIWNKNQLYLRVFVDRAHESYFSNDGKVVPYNNIQSLLRKRKESRKRPQVRTYAFDAIRRISINGQQLRRRRSRKFLIDSVLQLR